MATLSMTDETAQKMLNGFKEYAISKLSKKKNKSDNELEDMGLSNFGKKVFGRTKLLIWELDLGLSISSNKTLDELASILTEMKVANSAEEAKEFIKTNLYGNTFEKSNGKIEFNQVYDKKGKELCLVKLYAPFNVCDYN